MASRRRCAAWTLRALWRMCGASTTSVLCCNCWWRDRSWQRCPEQHRRCCWLWLRRWPCKVNTNIPGLSLNRKYYFNSSNIHNVEYIADGGTLTDWTCDAWVKPNASVNEINDLGTLFNSIFSFFHTSIPY